MYLQVGFRPLAVGDIHDRALVIADGAVITAHRPGILGDPDDAAILLPHLGLEADDLVVPGQRPDELVASLGNDIELVFNVPEVGDEVLGGGEAIDGGQCRIDIQVAPVGGGEENPLHRIREEMSIDGFGRRALDGVLSYHDGERPWWLK